MAAVRPPNGAPRAAAATAAAVADPACAQPSSPGWWGRSSGLEACPQAAAASWTPSLCPCPLMSRVAGGPTDLPSERVAAHLAGTHQQPACCGLDHRSCHHLQPYSTRRRCTVTPHNKSPVGLRDAPPRHRNMRKREVHGLDLQVICCRWCTMEACCMPHTHAHTDAG